METPEFTSRLVEWGDMSVDFESIRAPMDTTELFKGLPDDRCQCPHWGYVFKGKFRVKYADREEVVRAGDAYYLAPGHIPVVEEDTELVEFSPKGLFQQTMEAVGRNMAAAEEERT
ncbi:MAG: cupin domain-containing protein [Chloroflexi bacterium]|nr:cupin domain-containing protein [Chloroflexota bacterium]